MPVDIGGIILGVLGLILGAYYSIWLFFVVLASLGKRGREKALLEDEDQDEFSDSEALIYRSETGTAYKKYSEKGRGFWLSLFMPFILIAGFLIYVIIAMKIEEFHNKIIKGRNSKIIDQEMVARAQYLNEACEKESKMVVYKKIPLNAGFYTDGDYYKNHRKNQLYENFKSEIDQCKTMMEKQNKDTGSTIMEGEYCYYKYASLIRFVDNFDFFRGGGLIKYTKASFFEYFGYYYDNKDFFIDNVPIRQYIKGEEGYPHVYYDDHGHAIKDGKVFKRYATKAWWMHSGLGNIVTQWMHQYDGSQHIENIHNDDFVDDDIPVTQLLAHYRLDVEDISTLTDRHQGIRRGRIRLVDRSNQQVLSEYITFDIMDFYPKDSTVISSRSCLNRNFPKYEIEKTSGNPEIFEYFFKHALDETQTMPLQKADRL